MNLLSNAIKYNRPNGRVDVRMHVQSGKVEISVSDTGVGIDAKHRAGMFEPFNRLGVQRSEIEGSGLGLAITQQLVLLMGGELNVDSTPGEGSCFTVNFPQAHEVAAPVTASTAPSPAENFVPTSGGDSTVLRVLYVEDHPVNQQVMAACLTA